MKFVYSSLSAALISVTLTSVSSYALADNAINTTTTNHPVVDRKAVSQNSISQNSERQNIASSTQSVQTTQIADATYNVASVTSNRLANDKRSDNKLATLVDPITKRSVDNSYPLEVSSFLSLEQAQNILLQVSPKLAANEAAVASSNFQTQALSTIDKPFVFARVSASAYQIQQNIDLSTLKEGVINGINDNVNNGLGGDLGALIPPTSPTPELPNFGELIGERLPDSYDFKRSGTRTGAGIGVAWPIYTAGRTTALTGISNARTQEAIADGVLDKNQLYHTLIERYFKAQLAIIAAYLREDAYDTLQQTDYTAKRLFEEGFISRVDRLQAQSALADAQSESIKANNDARLAMIALQRLLRTEFRIKPTTPLFVSSRPLPDVSYYQNLALTYHPGLQKVAAKRAQAQQLKDLSDTGYKPTVLLYGYSQLERDPSWIAGVSASWKLWGGLDKNASIASSAAKIRQADLTEIEVSDNLLLLVEKNWHDVNNAQARYQALQSNVDLAQEVLRLRRLGLQEGVNTTIDVVQAQTQALKARVEQAQAANDYVQALASLMQSCGTPLAFNAYLNAADIRLPTLYQE